MKLILKPNYEKFSFQELVIFFNMYLGEEQNVYLKIEKEDKCILYNRDDNTQISEATEPLLRTYFEDEVEKEDISCFGFFQ